VPLDFPEVEKNITAWKTSEKFAKVETNATWFEKPVPTRFGIKSRD
jgi:hypothetical protein